MLRRSTLSHYSPTAIMEVAVSGFEHQVGGHFGLLQCEGHVAKPLDARELAFYKQLSPRFRKFAPAYCGTIRVRAAVHKGGRLRLWSEKRGATCHPLSHPSTSRDKVTRRPSATAVNVGDEKEKDEEEQQRALLFRVNEEGRVEVDYRNATHHWAANCQIKVVQKLLLAGSTGAHFILLENVVNGMVRPCVLDLKMGTRQHGDDAPLEKQHAQRRKCAESTSGALGVRMVGMELYEHDTESYSFIDKMQGRQMDEKHFSACLHRFVRGAGRTRAASLRGRLADLKSTLEEAEGFRFFSSSLLVAFDAALPDSPIQVRMIDFAHSTCAEFVGFSDLVYQGPDDGYIKGIESLLDRIPANWDALPVGDDDDLMIIAPAAAAMQSGQSSSASPSPSASPVHA